MQTYKTESAAYDIRTEVVDGVEHIVVPTVMMRTGVHHGSAGPVLHVIEELGKIVDSWNGIPVTIGHPMEGQGFVSANSPGQAENCVGRVYNTRVNGDKLMAEVWIQTNKIAAISPEALDHIINKKPLDVSVGVFSEDIVETGVTTNGEQYEAVARNYRPDHLALLPGDQGACSWNDGCGIRANQKSETLKEGGNKDAMNKEKEKQPAQFGSHRIQVSKSMQQHMTELRELLQATETPGTNHYLMDVFDEGYFVYEKDIQGRKPIMLRQDYTIEDGKIILEGEPQEVRREISYPLATNTQGDSRAGKTTVEKSKSNNQKEPEMEKKTSPCCMKKVEALMANERTRFATKEDREWLMTLEESRLDQLMPAEEEELQVNVDQAKEVISKELNTADEYIELMPEAMQKTMKEGLRLHQEMRNQHITHIQENTKDTWSEDELKAMPDETLEKLAKSVATPADYSALQANQKSENGDGVETDDDVMLPIGIKK